MFSGFFSSNSSSSSVSSAGAYSTVVGDSASSTKQHSVLVGYNTTGGGGRGIAVGSTASVNHNDAVVIGYTAVTTAVSRCTLGTIGGSYDLELQMGKGLAVWGGTPPGSQPTKISDPAGGGTIDAEARTAINSLIDALESYELTSPT